MTSTIQDLLKKREELSERLSKLDQAIDAFREICDHEWVPNGHDSHYNWEKCKICGEETKA